MIIKEKCWGNRDENFIRTNKFSHYQSKEKEKNVLPHILRVYIRNLTFSIQFCFSSGNTIRVNVEIVFAGTKVPRRRWGIIDNCAGVAAGELFARRANSGGGNFVREKLTVGAEPPSCVLAFSIMWKKFTAKVSYSTMMLLAHDFRWTAT